VVIDEIRDVADLVSLAADAAADGHVFVERMVSEWRDGTNRFERPGEHAWGVRMSGDLVAVGGLNVDPYVADVSVGRVRRLYVARATRRSGIGSILLDRIVAEASRSFSTLRLRTVNPEAAAFYSARGFKQVLGDEFCTHERHLGA
jgi:GNAT superfamily N-acetyltransferase